ncbi:MAG TPA: hypothetical protein VGI39_10480, partial [Polyangiaceae bacterium]
MTSPEEGMGALAALGREAAPAEGLPLHVPEAELARMRAGDESDALSAAYQHTASCAVCRARLLEPALPERIARLVRGASSGAPVVALPQRRRSFALLAAAAG